MINAAFALVNIIAAVALASVPAYFLLFPFFN